MCSGLQDHLACARAGSTDFFSKRFLLAGQRSTGKWGMSVRGDKFKGCPITNPLFTKLLSDLGPIFDLRPMVANCKISGGSCRKYPSWRHECRYIKSQSTILPLSTLPRKGAARGRLVGAIQKHIGTGLIQNDPKSVLHSHKGMCGYQWRI